MTLSGIAAFVQRESEHHTQNNKLSFKLPKMLMAKLENCRDVVTEHLYVLVLYEWYISMNSFLSMLPEVKCTLGLYVSK